MGKDLFETFLDHRRYLNKAGVKMEYIKGDNSPYIFIDNPIIISAFAGYVKNQHRKSAIYFRGEAGNHKHVVPSLFRSRGMPLTDNETIKQRFKAYTELKKVIQLRLRDKVSRFKNEDIDNLFQHYGIKSPVIDMVDNIYVAIWFAMDGNKEVYGYIRLLNTSDKELKVSDLRQSHSSLSLRLHTQHGLIAKKKVRDWNTDNIYYDQYEIARIKFPISRNIESGVLFSRENIYPDEQLDNTFKILKNEVWISDEIDRLISKYNLSKDDLGEIR
jgi:hypothetical protein